MRSGGWIRHQWLLYANESALSSFLTDPSSRCPAYISDDRGEGRTKGEAASSDSG